MSAQLKEKAPETTSESHVFSAEISKVLQLMIHSLYTNKDIFLRELISNASDACDKLRYEASQQDGLMEGGEALKITMSADEKAKTITIADTGIGMNREDLIANLGTIARSGTQEFFNALTGDSQKDVGLIGQFGVGFYSSFMIADRVIVRSRKAGDTQSWRWESDGLGSFTVVECDDHPRGTSITLHIKNEAKEYLDRFKLKFIAQTYSDHISFPIELIGEDGEIEPINEASAIWTRAKSDITDEQYQAFYRHVSHSPDKPYLTLHTKAEGTIEYTSLLFIPSMKPFDLYHPERRRRVKLYVKRVYITDEGVDLVPAYLRFLRGVIDSPDLPLNISRETLQANPALRKIREGVTKKVLADLSKQAKKDEAAYHEFWMNFGPVLKEGLCESDAPRDKIMDVCRFASTHGDALVSLEDYIGRMKEGQEAIYFLNADSLENARRSPQLEGFSKHGIEVLLLTDHVDDFWIGLNPKFKDKPLRSVLRSGADLESFGKKDDAKPESEKTENTNQTEALIVKLKAIYGDQVRDVRTTAKLEESPVCLAVGEGDMDPRMERFLMEHKQLPKGMPKILEINPTHPIIASMAAKLESAAFEDRAWLLLDQARLQEGEPIPDAAAFARRMNAVLMGS